MDNGIPMAPTEVMHAGSWKRLSGKGKARKMNLWAANLLSKPGWAAAGIVAKPEMGAYGRGVVKWSPEECGDRGGWEETLVRYLDEQFLEREYPAVLFQPNVTGFDHEFELRLYFIDEKYAYTVGTIIDGASLNEQSDSGLESLVIDVPASKGGSGRIPDAVVKTLSAVGSRVLEILHKDLGPACEETFLMIRVDFAACLVGDVPSMNTVVSTTADAAASTAGGRGAGGGGSGSGGGGSSGSGSGSEVFPPLPSVVPVAVALRQMEQERRRQEQLRTKAKKSKKGRAAAAAAAAAGPGGAGGAGGTDSAEEGSEGGGISPTDVVGYVVNEIELLACNLFPDYGKYDVMRRLGDKMMYRNR